MDIDLPSRMERLFLNKEEQRLFMALSQEGKVDSRGNFSKSVVNSLIERGYIAFASGTLYLTDRGKAEFLPDEIPYLPKTEVFATTRMQRILVEVAASTRVGNLKMTVAKHALELAGYSNVDFGTIKRELAEMAREGHMTKSGNNMYYLHVAWLYLFGLRSVNESNYLKIEEVIGFDSEEEKVAVLKSLGGTFDEKWGWVWGTKKTKAKPAKVVKTLESLADDDPEYSCIANTDVKLELPAESTLDADAMLAESISYVDQIVEKARKTSSTVDNKEQKIKFLNHLSEGLFLDNKTCQELLNSIAQDLEKIN
ncbi:MAG: hypothetical protein CBC55_03775 [Gammaproteobacteria bacterium TMED95]|nr:MAG: hypothetical protein CBC55_03775 [Gammaproteobacteria bacterium TMED95]|tara:strand:- start:2661 stop:3593 length:933 start_codon:yes stop_codon:yes gene_type:complete